MLLVICDIFETGGFSLRSSSLLPCRFIVLHSSSNVDNLPFSFLCEVFGRSHVQLSCLCYTLLPERQPLNCYFNWCLLKIYTRCLGTAAQKLLVVLQNHLAIFQVKKENCFFYDLLEIYLLQVSIMSVLYMLWGYQPRASRWSSLNVLQKSLQGLREGFRKVGKEKDLFTSFFPVYFFSS